MLTELEWTHKLEQVGTLPNGQAKGLCTFALIEDHTEMQARIAALEAQMRADAEGALLLTDAHKLDLEVAHRYGRVRLAAANLRAERLAGALETAIDELEDAGSQGGHAATCQLMDSRASAPPHSKRACTCGLWERVEALRAALAAEPSTSPLRQVQQALVWMSNLAQVHIEHGSDRTVWANFAERMRDKARAALRLLAELGVSDAA